MPATRDLNLSASVTRGACIGGRPDHMPAAARVSQLLESRPNPDHGQGSLPSRSDAKSTKLLIFGAGARIAE